MIKIFKWLLLLFCKHRYKYIGKITYVTDGKTTGYTHLYRCMHCGDISRKEI